MNRIDNVLKDRKAFIGFVMAGDPTLKKTEDFVLELERGGASIVEIGIPFSDPVAEGVVIQNSTIRALKNNVTTDDVFDLVISLRAKTQIPLVFLTYLNPVFKYGYDKFFNKCNECGVDGIIIPDIPYEEKNEVLEVSKKYNVKLISLIAPTSEDRIEKIAKGAEGFVYCVSSMGVTGIRNEFKTDIRSVVKKIKTYTDVPVAVGFGISTPQQAKEMCEFADGAIVGSKIVKIIEEFGENSDEELYKYAISITNNIN